MRILKVNEDIYIANILSADMDMMLEYNVTGKALKYGELASSGCWKQYGTGI